MFDMHGDALPLAKITLTVRSGVALVDTAFVKRRLHLALTVEAVKLKAGIRKLETQHTLDPKAGIDVVLSSLAPIFKFEDMAKFMHSLHKLYTDGVTDVVPRVESGRMEMIISLSGD